MAMKRVGLVVFWVGSLYMVLVGFLMSWWYVPSIKEFGFNNLPFPGSLTFLWAISAPLGAILAAIGASLYAQIQPRRFWYLGLGSVAIFILPVIFVPSEPIPVLFGIDGGLIMIFFLGILWHWAKNRNALSISEKSALDLQMVGYVFFLMAAWWLCGLLGAPTFTLRPDLMDKYGTQSGAAPLGSLVSILLAIGWAFIFFGHRLSLQAKNKAA
ncbi:hypothetical protein ACFL4X_02170 [Gemmatimonadota bacterium]